MFGPGKTYNRANTHRPSMENGTQSHSVKFLNWGDPVNSVPDLAASPPPPVYRMPMKSRLLGTSLPIDDPRSKNSFLAQFWPTKQAFFGSKTTRKQTRYHDNQATVFRKLQFFYTN